MRNKYGNRKVIVDGMEFDSKKEARRWRELTYMQKAGIIQDLKRQVKYVLIPTQREECHEVYQKGPRKGQPKQGKVLENECSYIADFTYYENGVLVVEDTKGVRTHDYILKRKMMLYIHGIQIREI